jgi:ribonuclease Z
MCNAANKVAKDADLLICEATYLDELKDKAAEYKHLTAAQAAKLAKKNKVKKLVLTHISQRYEHEPKRLLAEAKRIFQKAELAEDFTKIKL